jgi:hypothetical protein
MEPNAILDIFNSNAFSVTELSMAMDLIPVQWGRLGELNVFPEESVMTTSVAIEYRNNQLYLLPARPRGGPASVGGVGRRGALPFNLLHLPHEDAVTADEIQNVRGFGLPVQMETAMNVVNRKLLTMRNKHDITLEHLRAGAMQGIIYDSDGTTVLLNLFTAFGVSQPNVYFDWAGNSYNIVHLCNQVKRWVQDKLMGDTLDHIRAFCAPDFFDAMLNNPTVLKAYQLYTARVEGGNPISDDYTMTRANRAFPFGGIIWEEYRAYAGLEAADGTVTTQQFLPNGTCRFVPMGTKFSMKTFFGPGTFLETVNTAGLKFYAKMAPEKYGRRWDIYSESNPLPICTKPALLIQGNAATGAGTAGLT